jgi:hypothetical protein
VLKQISTDPAANQLEPPAATPFDRRLQIGGDHYANLAVQPWDVMRATFSPEEFNGFLRGNIIKYVMRDKGNRLEDLKKAQHYLGVLIAEMETDEIAPQ